MGLSEDYERRQVRRGQSRSFMSNNSCAEGFGLVPEYICAASFASSPCRRFTRLSGGAVVVVQHAAQAPAPLDRSRLHKVPRLWKDQPIAQPLVIALRVVVGDRVLNGRPQRLLSK